MQKGKMLIDLYDDDKNLVLEISTLDGSSRIEAGRSSEPTFDWTVDGRSVVFTTPVQTGKGTWMSSRTTAIFDCAAKKLAARENVYYGDAKETKVVEKKVNAQPGYSVALGGSMGALAMQYLCAAK